MFTGKRAKSNGIKEVTCKGRDVYPSDGQTLLQRHQYQHPMLVYVQILLAPPQRLPLGIPIKIAGESAELQESSLLPVIPLPHYDDS